MQFSFKPHFNAASDKRKYDHTELRTLTNTHSPSRRAQPKLIFSVEVWESRIENNSCSFLVTVTKCPILVLGLFHG